MVKLFEAMVDFWFCHIKKKQYQLTNPKETRINTDLGKLGMGYGWRITCPIHNWVYYIRILISNMVYC